MTPGLAGLRRFLRRLTASSAFRIRSVGPRFELHERSGAGWRLCGLFSSYEEAEAKAEAAIRLRRRS